MTTLKVTTNAEQAFKNFAFLDTVEDVNDFEKMLALFLAGKFQTTVERMNDDCTWRTEIVRYAA